MKNYLNLLKYVKAYKGYALLNISCNILSVIFSLFSLTITGARVSPDLSIATIQLSIFNSKESKKVLEMIEKHNKEIRKQLGTRIRHQARIIPELKFFLDDSLDYVEKIEKLLKETKLPPEKDWSDVKMWRCANV